MNYLNAVLDVAGYRWRLRYVSLGRRYPGGILSPKTILYRLTANYASRMDQVLVVEQPKDFAHEDSHFDNVFYIPRFTFSHLTPEETAELLCQVIDQIGEPDGSP